MENYTTWSYSTSLDGFDVPVTPHVYSRLYHVIGCPWSRDESLNQLLKRAGDATERISGKAFIRVIKVHECVGNEPERGKLENVSRGVQNCCVRMTKVWWRQM